MKKLAMAVTCLLLLSPAAWAGAYVGGSIGQADADSGGDGSSWKVLGGFTFAQYMGVEASYRDLGGDSQTIGTTELGYDASSMDVFGVGRLELGEKFGVFAKAGLAFIDVEAWVTDPLLGTISTSDSESEFAYGVGFDYSLGEKFALRGEYESLEFDVISLGGVFRF